MFRVTLTFLIHTRRYLEIGFLVVAILMPTAASVNLALLIERLGWAERTKNTRVFIHTLNSILLVVGMDHYMSVVLETHSVLTFDDANLQIDFDDMGLFVYG